MLWASRIDSDFVAGDFMEVVKDDTGRNRRLVSYGTGCLRLLLSISKSGRLEALADC